MKHLKRSVSRSVIVGGLVLAVGALAAASWQSALGQSAALTIDAPTSVSAGGANFDVRIEIEGAQNLGAYEWQLSFDPEVVEFKSATNGPFLGSTGRTASCQPPILPPSQDLQPGNVRFGCGTSLTTPDGPSGSGLLTTVTFSPLAGGSPNIQFVCAGLANPLGDSLPISNVPDCVAAITPTPGPGQTPAPTSTPGPGQPTSTPGGPAPSPAATATPTGPLPTPTPLPPGLEAIGLARGCNPVASTYPDGTSIQTIDSRVGRAGILKSIWKFRAGTWEGYSPQFPDVSDLTEVNFLDPVFICVYDPGDFVRPLV